MKPDSADARASIILRELSCANHGQLVAAVCASRDSTSRRLAKGLASGGIEVALIAPEPAGVLEELREHPLDVVVCAVSARDGGLAEVRALRGRSPHTQLVLVTGSTSRPRLRRMLDLGAEGVVLDSQVSRALVPAVRAACGGLVCVPTELSESVGCGPLTRRQQEVLRLAAEGRANAEIAHDLYLSESTVKAHLSAAFAKVGVRSRSEASALMRDPEIGRPLRTRGLAAEL